RLAGGMHPQLAAMTTGLGEVLMYSVEAIAGSPVARLEETARLGYLRTVQDYQIRPALKRIQGVADVDSTGGYKKEFHVDLIPKRLEATGQTLESVAHRLEGAGERTGGGYLELPGRRGSKQVIARTDSGIADAASLARWPIGLDFQGR